ncbi:ATP-dependent DNA helicase [Trichonephila clavipes]|nr:ATP-dependent DNA helicase [Trichonephila clavipes]
MPPHNLQLKIDFLVILLRNLNPPRLCNGTCLFIEIITEKLLEANILTAKFKEKIVLLPHVPLISPESPIPFKSAIKRNHKTTDRARRPQTPLTPHHRQCRLDFCRGEKTGDVSSSVMNHNDDHRSGGAPASSDPAFQRL